MPNSWGGAIPAAVIAAITTRPAVVLSFVTASSGSVVGVGGAGACLRKLFGEGVDKC
jgi:hypothetical protein